MTSHPLDIRSTVKWDGCHNESNFCVSDSLIYIYLKRPFRTNDEINTHDTYFIVR